MFTGRPGGSSLSISIRRYDRLTAKPARGWMVYEVLPIAIRFTERKRAKAEAAA
jgi:hypothetical protein